MPLIISDECWIAEHLHIERNSSTDQHHRALDGRRKLKFH